MSLAGWWKDHIWIGVDAHLAVAEGICPLCKAPLVPCPRRGHGTDVVASGICVACMQDWGLMMMAGNPVVWALPVEVS